MNSGFKNPGLSSYFFGLLLLASACADPGDSALERRLGEIEAVLDAHREAHLRTDASALSEGVADTLLGIDAGMIREQSREQVKRMFESYFEGATYHAWQDTEPPRISISADGTMAWVARRVRVDREEPASEGGARRQFVSAYTSTFERSQDGRWRMTSVTSTFMPPGQ